MKGWAIYRRFVFDFVEKVLLGRLVRRPDQLHFTAGLKFLLNAVCTSDTGREYFFGLPERHWPKVKIANVVTLMLFHHHKAQFDNGSASDEFSQSSISFEPNYSM